MDKSPDAFRTISEVADDLDLPQHVLRFWETRFTQIKPMKRGGGRRYYRPEDVDLLKGIRHLLYDHGYTIKGVQKLLKLNGNKFVAAIASGDLATVEALAAASHEEPAPPKAGSDEDQIVGRAKAPASRRFSPSSAAPTNRRKSRWARPASARKTARCFRKRSTIFWSASVFSTRSASRAPRAPLVAVPVLLRRARETGQGNIANVFRFSLMKRRPLCPLKRPHPKTMDSRRRVAPRARAAFLIASRKVESFRRSSNPLTVRTRTILRCRLSAQSGLTATSEMPFRPSLPRLCRMPNWRE